MDSTAKETLLRDAFQSSPVEFRIGPSAVAYFVHSDLVAAHSPVLQKMIHGGFSEARTGIITLDNVEEATFECFLQFVYTQGYDAPAPSLSQGNGQTNLGMSFVSCCNCCEDLPIRSKSATHMRCTVCGSVQFISQPSKPDSRLWYEFHELGYQLNSTEGSNLDWDDGYASVFTGHAKLYVFADRYLIPELQHIALSRLYNCLRLFYLWDKRLSDVTALLQYVVNHTSDGTGCCRLRSLVIHYVSCYLAKMTEDKVFLSLLEQHAALGRDIVLMLGSR